MFISDPIYKELFLNVFERKFRCIILARSRYPLLSLSPETQGIASVRANRFYRGYYTEVILIKSRMLFLYTDTFSH